MVVVSVLPHKEFGPNNHWEDVLYFTFHGTLTKDPDGEIENSWKKQDTEIL